MIHADDMVSSRLLTGVAMRHDESALIIKEAGEDHE